MTPRRTSALCRKQRALWPTGPVGEDQLLAYAETCAETARQAEVNLLRVAYQWAVVHAPDRLGPATASQPGRERSRMFGGAGTPEVSEFAAAQLGVRPRRTSPGRCL